jgi:acyl-CoA reductase-like NAD-dependent aldehyde dehydrogenase
MTAQLDFFPALSGGCEFASKAGHTLSAVNPATGETIAQFPRFTPEDVDAAVQSAHAAFLKWKRTPPRQRAEMLLALADAVEADRERLLLLDVRDNGSPISEMKTDIDIGVMYLRYFAGLALEVRGETIPVSDDRLNYTIRDPFGVVVRIIPFNHPLMFALRTLAAPLVTGNTVVLKPSEHTSLSTLALSQHIRKIFPPGVISIVTGTGREAGDALVCHPLVRRIAFIGHDRTGRLIQERAAQTGVKTVTLELGGKNPIIIWPDADIDAAIDGAVAGMRFNFQSQACGSTSRLLIHRDMHDVFVERLAARLESIRAGMPEDRSTETGAIVNEAQMNKVLRYIEIGREEGGRLIAGGYRLMNDGFDRGLFVRPTLFTNVRPDSRLAKEEIFGPVLAAMSFDDFDDALAIANDTPYGLSASLYTRDLSVAHRFARDIAAGYVWINENQRHFLGTPFGGIKDSGIGKEEDPSELLSYTQVKNVHLRFDSEWLS